MMSSVSGVIGNPGAYRSSRTKGRNSVKKLLGCLVLGFAVLTTNVTLVGCKGDDTKKEKTAEEKAKEAKDKEAKDAKKGT